MGLSAADFRGYRERLLSEMLALSRTGLTERQLRSSLGECDWLLTRCRAAIPAPEHAQFKAQQKAWLRASQPDVAKTAAACRLMLKGFLDAIERKALQLAQEGTSPAPSPASRGQATASNFRNQGRRKPGAESKDETWSSRMALLHAKVGEQEQHIEALSRTLQDREDQLHDARGEIASLTRKLTEVDGEKSALQGQIARLTAKITIHDEARRHLEGRGGAKTVQGTLPLPEEQLALADLLPTPAAKPAHFDLEKRLAALETNIAELKRRKAVAV